MSTQQTPARSHASARPKWSNRPFFRLLAGALRDGIEYRGEVAGTIAAYSVAAPYLPGDQVGLQMLSVSNGGNLRRAARIEGANVVGQVCPGDQLVMLEQQLVDKQLWYRVRMIVPGADCDAHRVPTGAAGWLSGLLTE